MTANSRRKSSEGRGNELVVPVVDSFVIQEILQNLVQDFSGRSARNAIMLLKVEIWGSRLALEYELSCFGTRLCGLCRG